MPIRHANISRLTPRGITPRRLAAAKRFLKRERDHLPLFADEVAAEQPTPEQRIEQADEDLLDYVQSHRDLAARHWKRARRWLSGVSEDTRAEITALWNRRTCPPTAAYFADFVRSELRRRRLPVDDDA